MKPYKQALLFLLVLLAGCGGGGGGGTGTPQTRSAAVTLSTTGTPATIGDIEVALNLPPGVTVRSVPSSVNPAVQVPALGVINLKNTALATSALVASTYTPATQGTPGKVVLVVAATAGIPVGEAFATVACDIAAGSSPVPGDFSVTPNRGTTGVFDNNPNGAVELTGVSVQYSAVVN